MAWEFWLPVDGADIQRWDFLHEVYRACRERAAALGAIWFPRTNQAWEQGVVTGVTSTTMTDSTKAWPSGRWAGYNPGPPANLYTPRDYDLIFDSCDPKLIVRAQIGGNTATVLSISDITQHVTERVIPDIASLVGRHYVIIKRYGLWWHERRMQWPNPRPFDQGLVRSPTITTIEDPTKFWVVNEHVGRDLMFMGQSGLLQRVVITANTHTTLTWGSSVGSGNIGIVEDPYYIVGHDAKWEWNREPDPAFAWYRGTMDSYWSHDPYDNLIGAPVPKETISWLSGTGGAECEDTGPIDLFDNDPWSDLQEECSEADEPKNPNVFRSLRMIQAWLEQVCNGFVENRSYAGYTGPAIPFFCPATWLNLAGINPRSGVSGTVSGGGLTVGLGSMPFLPIEVYYAVLDEFGQVLTEGKATYDGTRLLGVGTPPPPGESGPLDGKTIKASLGWTRWIEREFRYFYDRTRFFPDLGDTGLPVDPPTEEHPGYYETRAKSDHYTDHDNVGRIVDSSLAMDAFATGNLARYVGDNFWDPTTSFQTGGTPPVLLGYYDGFFTGSRYDTREDYDAHRGFATGGSTTQLRDTNQSWTGTRRTESGTATGGSDVTLTDTTKASSAFWDGTTGRWIGFILEVNFSDDPEVEDWQARPITDQSGTTLTVDPAYDDTASGRDYRIREPGGDLMRWAGRVLRVQRKADLSWHDVPILNSGDDVLFFDTQLFAVEEGDLYEILESSTGTVWKWDGVKWVKPVGADARPGGQPFLLDQTANLPTQVKRFGRLMAGDVLWTGLFGEIYDGINKLTATQNGADWVMPNDTDFNHHDVSGDMYQAGSEDTSTYQDLQDTFKGLLNDEWTGDGVMDENFGNALNAPPAANSNLGAGDCGYEYPPGSGLWTDQYTTGGASTTYNYPHTDGIPNGSYCPVSCTADFYGYTQYDNFDAIPTANDPDPHPDVTGYIVFDTFGHFTGAWHEWALLTSSGPSTNVERFGPQVGGGASMPPLPANRECGDYGEGHGYYIANVLTVLRWSFTYVA